MYRRFMLVCVQSLTFTQVSQVVVLWYEHLQSTKFHFNSVLYLQLSKYLSDTNFTSMYCICSESRERTLNVHTTNMFQKIDNHESWLFHRHPKNGSSKSLYNWLGPRISSPCSAEVLQFRATKCTWIYPRMSLRREMRPTSWTEVVLKRPYNQVDKKGVGRQMR